MCIRDRFYAVSAIFQPCNGDQTTINKEDMNLLILLLEETKNYRNINNNDVIIINLKKMITIKMIIEQTI